MSRKFEAMLVKVERVGLTRNGNPVYELTLIEPDESGREHALVTRGTGFDSACSYDVDNLEVKRLRKGGFLRSNVTVDELGFVVQIDAASR